MLFYFLYCFVKVISAYPGKDLISEEAIAPDGSQTRLSGGYDLGRPLRRYQLQIFRENAPFCSGVVLNRLHLLTSAHCVQNAKPEELTVKGNSVMLGEGDTIPIMEIIQHPDFEYPFHEYDIAVLRAFKDIDVFDIFEEVYIEAPGSKMPEKIQLSGWGFRGDGQQKYSPVLYVAIVPIINPVQCDIFYPGQPITKNMICAYDNRETDVGACEGDGGGPAMEGGTVRLLGIISFSAGCGPDSRPTVITFVQAKEIQDFIVNTTRLIPDYDEYVLFGDKNDPDPYFLHNHHLQGTNYFSGLFPSLSITPRPPRTPRPKDQIDETTNDETTTAIPSERPEHEQPERPSGRPEHERPEHERPDHGRPSHERPDHGRPGHERLEHGRPGHERPEHGRPEHERPGHERPGHERPERERPGHERSEYERSEMPSERSEYAGSEGPSGQFENERPEGSSGQLEHEGSERSSGQTELESPDRSSGQLENEGTERPLRQLEHKNSERSSKQLEHEGSERSSGQLELEVPERSSGQLEQESLERSSGQLEHEGSERSSGQLEQENLERSSGQLEHEGSKRSSARTKKPLIDL